MQTHFTPKANHSSLVFAGSRVVGQVCGEVFKKTVAGSKHFLRQPPAIAFDVCSLDMAERMGSRLVEVTDLESGRVYRASLALVRGAGFAVSREFGAQIALPLSYFSIDGNPPTSGPAKVQQRPAEVQPRLF